MLREAGAEAAPCWPPALRARGDRFGERGGTDFNPPPIPAIMPSAFSRKPTAEAANPAESGWDSYMS